MAANGYLPASGLVTVQTGIRLSPPTSIAWSQLRVAARTSLKRNINIATPAGGYRSFAVQATLKQVAAHGTAAEKRFWNLSTSTASLAAPGQSAHGLGICVDVVGTPIDTAFVALAKRFGFTRPLPGDPNHFQHDGKTAIHGETPGVTKVYTVKPGDYLAAIGRRYGVTVAHLLKVNPGITNPDLIRVGQRIKI